MNDQQLAHALIEKKLVTMEQVQQAARERSVQKSFASVLLEHKWVTEAQLREIDPGLFSAKPTEPAVAVGIGHEDVGDLDDSGVRVEGEEEHFEDPTQGAIITYCNELLKIAVQMRASDMHLEPTDQGLQPRYRIDGQLRSGGLIPRELQPSIVSRFKVLSQLNITETRLPQDGRFRASVGGKTFDFRVSTLPSMHGEKVVLRLLDRTALVTDLRQLGFSDADQKTFLPLLNRSQGMILVTGPTGSGKTTTLYAALANTRDETKNVVTVEDPVEYALAGVTQTKVQSEIGLTFATQLRAILRQDPDVILVGEIRDEETANIAIRAALTGHLVLSTLHTNSAPGAITRMMDMGVPPYLIASSLTCVLAQRLARMICRECKTPIPESDPQYQTSIELLGLERGFPLFKGAGCEHCNHTGMRGRLAIIELFVTNNELRKAIMRGADSSEIQKIAVDAGMTTLWKDGLEKLRQGLTSAEEIARVVMTSDD
jgi:type II secretory ATPase GspE/PulE/Tfp pilus assembly ATPase PilB-like protein